MSYKLKYKMAIQKLLSISSEIKLQEEAIQTANFDAALANYCLSNNIKLKNEQPNDISKYKKIINSNLPSIQNETKKNETKNKKNPLAKIYKKIAKLTHPDLFTKEGKETYAEKENTFKKATAALENNDWSSLLKIADDLGVEPDDYRIFISKINKQIKNLEIIKKSNKQKYGYLFYECDDEECRLVLIKRYLKIHFNIKED